MLRGFATQFNMLQCRMRMLNQEARRCAVLGTHVLCRMERVAHVIHKVRECITRAEQRGICD